MDQTENLNYHLVELRKRLTWSAAVVVCCTVVAFVFHQQILELLMFVNGFVITEVVNLFITRSEL